MKEAQKIYTASGGYFVQSSEIDSVPTFSFRTCVNSCQDLRITGGPLLKLTLGTF